MPKDKTLKNGRDAGHASQDDQIKAALIQEINLALEGKSPDKLKEGQKKLGQCQRPSGFPAGC